MTREKLHALCDILREYRTELYEGSGNPRGYVSLTVDATSGGDSYVNVTVNYAEGEFLNYCEIDGRVVTDSISSDGGKDGI